MAIKFSQFDVVSTVADIDYLVGYKATDNIQIPIGLVNITYDLTSAQSATNVELRLSGSDLSLDTITLAAGSGISLTNVNNVITIDSSDANTTYTLPVTGGASSAVLTLTGSDASADPVTITAGSDIQFSALTSGGFTIDSTFVGDTYDLNSSTNGASIDLNLTSGSGTDNSLVTLTPAGGITITQAGNIVTIDSSALGIVDSVVAGTGISVNNTDPVNPIVSNTGVLSNIAGTGISISGATGDSTITNTAPDQTVVITGTGDTVVTGTYPTFNVSSDSGVTQIVAGNDISISPVGGTGVVTINSTSQGGVTSLIAGDNVTLSPVSGLGDVTVGAPGLIPYVETSTASMQFVSEDVALGGGASSDTVLSSQLAIKTYVDNAVVGGLIYQGAYDAATNTPVLDSRGTQIAVTKGWTYTVTVDGTFYGETVKVGDVLIAETDLVAGTGALTDWTTVQSNIDLATAGTTATAVRGLAGFDSNDFTVTGGFVEIIDKGYVPYTGATQNVDLGTRTLTSGDLTVNHASGSGTAVTINKGGNGAGLLINKTSGSGDALSVTGSANISNSITASSFVKSAGTSVQFLKADGSVDSNTYLTNAVTSFTASNGSFINLTPTTTQSGAATLTGDLSATGTPDATTFLRGDNAWVTVAGTTYDYSSIQSGTDVDLNLTPSSGTVDTVKLVAGSGISLTDDGSNNVTIAASSSSSSSIAKDDFVGDGTTVAFTLSVQPFSTLFTSVYIAGVYQEKETYSITGTTLTFTTAPPNLSSVEVMSVVVSNISPGANTITRNDFTGTGSQTDYTLTVAPSSINFVDVYVSGTYQNKDTFTIVGTTLSFSEAPANSDEIEVIIISNVSLVQNEQVNYGVNTISTSTTASKNNLYVLIADLTLTLPITPANGDSIKISNLSGVATCILGRNGSLIMGVASDLTLDTPSASFELIYSGATKGWVIVGL